MNKAINIAKFFVNLSAANESAVHGEEYNKMIMSVLRGFGYDRDRMAAKRTKLKDGSYLYYVELFTGGGNVIIDPLLPDGHCEGEHPRSEEFKGRGRDPIDKPEDAGELTIQLFLQAFMVLPKIPSTRNRDDPYAIGFRAKDLRQQLKRIGVVATYDNIDSLMSTIEGAKKLEASVKCYQIATGMSVIEWVDSKMSIAAFVDQLTEKYVISTKATG